MTKKPVQLTPQGFAKIKEELRYLVEVRRQQISDNMGTAIADGDLRESAAYDEARMACTRNELSITRRGIVGYDSAICRTCEECPRGRECSGGNRLLGALWVRCD